MHQIKQEAIQNAYCGILWQSAEKAWFDNACLKAIIFIVCRAG
jgi:hypothetical protein